MAGKAMRSTLQRFWSKVNKDGLPPSHCPEIGPCWVWTGSLNDKGYGVLEVGGRQARKVLRAHRLSWEIHNRSIPDALMVLHRCDNPPCCNPSHLFIGTQTDNMQDSLRKGRRADTKGEKNARAKFTTAEVLHIRCGDTKDIPASILAKQYGVQPGAIWKIRQRRTWTHI